jgi:hypothetical protein
MPVLNSDTVHVPVLSLDTEVNESTPGTATSNPINLPQRHRRVPTPIVPTSEAVIDVPVKPAQG